MLTMLEYACHYSPVLTAAFNSVFLEGQTQTYRFDDISPSAFRLLVKWLYSERIDRRLDTYFLATCPDLNVDKEEMSNGTEDNDHNEDDQENDKLKEAWRAQDLDLAQLWVAGDRLLIPRLQNEVMLAWHALWTEGKDTRLCSTSWVSFAYTHTCKESPLRHLAVDQHAYNIHPDDITKYTEELPREMLLDLFFTYSRAVLPINDSAVDYVPGSNDILDGVLLLMETERYQYRCTRNWRGYLVPEDEEK